MSEDYTYPPTPRMVRAEELDAMRARAEAAERERDAWQRNAAMWHDKADAAEAIADNMLNHLLPDTIRAIVLDISAAEHYAFDFGEFALLPQTLEFRNKCATFLEAEWPGSAWDQKWTTALEAKRSRRAHAQQSEKQLADNWLNPATDALEARDWQRENDPRKVQS